MSDAIVYLEDVTVAYEGFKALDRLNFFMDRRELQPSPAARDAAAAQRLWEISEEQIQAPV